MRTGAQVLLSVLLNAAWQIVLVVAFASLCAWVLRETAAWQRHAVWVAALVLSFCLPVLSSASLINPLFVSGPAPPASVVESLPAGATLSQEIEAPAGLDSPGASAAVDPAPQGFVISRIRLNSRLADGLALFYVLFLLYRVAKLFRAWRRTRTIIGTSYSMPFPAPLETIIARCQKAIGVQRVRIVFSPLVPVPITAGVFNPLIILPERLLGEADRDVLATALGHELVHVARRDYLLNLLYELIYLPLSFHPATGLLRRRIRQTREVCCDEAVAAKLLRPEIYARSLVQLIGSAPLAGQLAADTTIGIMDADILEVRIMSLLRRPKLSARRRAILLVAASLLLATPCVAAASFALTFDIRDQEPAASQPQEVRPAAELQRAHEELKRKEQELKDRVRKNPNPQGAELEALRRVERELAEAAAKIDRQAREHSSREATERFREVQANLAQHQAQVIEAQERYKELVTKYPQKYPQMKEYVEALEAFRRAETEIAAQQQELAKEQDKDKEEKLKLKQIELKKRMQSVEDKLHQKEIHKLREGELREGESQDRVHDVRIRKEIAESRRVERARKHAELTSLATISMDRAIQVATSQYPGKVLACSLGRDERGVFYHLVIVTTEGDKSTSRYVWVSATDGQILKSEKE